MPSLTIKNLPEELLSKMKRLAASHHRSLNKEIIACLEQASADQLPDIESVLRKARGIREKTAGYDITNEGITRAKSSGRP